MVLPAISPQLRYHRERADDPAYRRKNAEREAKRRDGMTSEQKERNRAYSKRYRAANREKSRKANREYMAQRRTERKAFIYALKDRPCMDCGGEFHPVCMQFDHRDSTQKKFNVGERFALARMVDLEAEIAKCDIVCANCHALRTWRGTDGVHD